MTALASPRRAADGPAPSAPPPSARIGPNAILQTADEVVERWGPDRLAAVLTHAGLARYLAEPPEGMVPEAEVMGLARVLHEELGADAARQVFTDAGRRTAMYLLAHRIPAPARWLMRTLPPRPAARVLLAAMARHAWTFAGSGTFHWALTPEGATLMVVDSPMARGVRTPYPVCDFYRGTFERLFRRLVAPQAAVAEVLCAAQGGPACHFEVRW